MGIVTFNLWKNISSFSAFFIRHHLGVVGDTGDVQETSQHIELMCSMRVTFWVQIDNPQDKRSRGDLQNMLIST